jgi:hypothetical protein
MTDKNDETQETESEDTLFDAIDEAIVEVSPHLGESNDDDTSNDAAADATSGEAAEGDGDKDEVNDTVDVDGDADKDSGDNTDTDGADKEGDKTSEGEDGDKSADAESDATPDHLNDPVPDTLKKETQERIQSLITTAKEQTTRAEQGDQIVSAITDSGADPDQFTNTLGFLTLYNSKDPSKRAEALKIVRGIVNELSIDLGEGSVELLTSHEDLQAQVEAGTLDEKLAIELATAREQKTLNTSRATHAQETKNADSEVTQLLAQGKQDLVDFEASVKAEPEYAALYSTLASVLQTTLRTVHPSQYGDVAREVYARLKANYVAPVAAIAPAKTPLRATASAGGSSSQKQEAGSALEAMDAAIELA